MSSSQAKDAPARVVTADNARWFFDEVRPHEMSLRGYLHRSFPSIGDIDDVVQESYLRILRARAAHPIHSAKAFLFTIARRLALDDVSRRGHAIDRSISRLDESAVIDDRPDAAEAAMHRERVRLLAEAIAALPARCREVFVLHKIKELSRKEVAAQLGLAEKTVEVQTAKAVRRCREHFRRRGVDGLFNHEI